jgi:hypothetical protein
MDDLSKERYYRLAPHCKCLPTPVRKHLKKELELWKALRIADSTDRLLPQDAASGPAVWPQPFAGQPLLGHP